jgi:hypothetical protein
MVEAKKARSKGTRTSAKSAKQTVAAEVLDVASEMTLDLTPASLPAVPSIVEPVEVVQLAQASQARGEVLRKAVSETVAVSARGALEVNEKIIEALQAQSDAAFEIWRSALSAPRLADAIRVQASGTRQAYEAASAQWTDIAKTTAHWLNKSLEPLQSALHQR